MDNEAQRVEILVKFAPLEDGRHVAGLFVDGKLQASMSVLGELTEERKADIFTRFSDLAGACWGTPVVGRRLVRVGANGEVLKGGDA